MMPGLVANCQKVAHQNEYCMAYLRIGSFECPKEKPNGHHAAPILCCSLDCAEQAPIYSIRQTRLNDAD